MTQRIFKKSNKQDMIDLFNILPNWVNYICRFTSNETNICYESKPIFETETISFITFYCFQEKDKKSHHLFENLINIDFETDKPEEMIIKRPMEEDNDK